MPEQYGSSKHAVGELLSVTSSPLVVPEWQRNFSWTSTEVESFWQDLIAFSDTYPDANVKDKEYFLGSIVVVNKEAPHTLLDGQQRLATSTILLSVIRDYMRRFKSDAGDRIQNRYIADFDDMSNTTTFRLTLNRFDRTYFKNLIQEPTDPEPSQDIESHKLIRGARNFFVTKFEEAHKDVAPVDAFNWTLRLAQVLTNHMSVVAVTSTDEDNAASVFETLNDRGIGLSTPDLLRNLVLRRAGDDDREEIIDCWQTVLELEDVAKVDAFLRHYWLSLHGDVKKQKLYREIKGDITEKNTNSLAFSQDLAQAAGTYRTILEAKEDDEKVQESLEAIGMLNANPILPAALSLYEDAHEAIRAEALRHLVVFFVRFNTIGNLENSKLESTLFALAAELRSDKPPSLETIRTRLADIAPDDAQFETKFGTIAITRRATQRYLLRALEHHKRVTDEVTVSLPGKVHVEHIYPQQPMAGARWANHAAAVNRLGNLTLLAKSINTSLKNKPFVEKKVRYKDSDLILTQELLGLAGWTMAELDTRQAALATTAVEIWKFASGPAEAAQKKAPASAPAAAPVAPAAPAPAAAAAPAPAPAAPAAPAPAAPTASGPAASAPGSDPATQGNS